MTTPVLVGFLAAVEFFIPFLEFEMLLTLSLATGELVTLAFLVTHVTQKPKKVSETAIPSEIAAKP